MVNIAISNLQKKLPIPRMRIKRLILKILKEEGVNKPGYINICFTDNNLIKRLNTKFLRANSATDVLAFNLSNKKTYSTVLADIVISTDSAISNARSFKTAVGDELLLYVAHGVLHILGFDDHTKAQAQLMRKKEKEYVN
ncbi:MAG: rRNA maturation RNase YbeY [Candidatus Omnitrophica bacterium]|nr:rRNA maturation RNase YbeY [Candidatus Omnitrophota bacterium]MBU1923743.1 rRNA maturation RNase YbeY [Candidatus Omnitrophota bacterium]